MNKFGHLLNAAFLAVGLGVILQPTLDAETARTIASVSLPVVLGALLPDADTAFGRHRKTLHNLFVLGIVLAYPAFFDNLRYVWIGVATHFVLDFFGSKRGLALLYPLSEQEFGSPTGVTTSSKYAPVVTVVVSAVELAAAAAIVQFAPPEAVRAWSAVVAQ
ncbi:hypothetical protein BRD17_08465 [Halobacteriales archaeon SW_7_68_16]|nr:MAG: hypothetical protein BRD17_08465 [Halobacteriales archaeon SW_7_68_16]